MDALGELPPPSHDRARAYKIDHAGMVDKYSFKVVAGIFCALAVAAALVRLATRFTTRRRFYFDDFLVLIAVLSLGAATGVLYHYCDALYLVEAMNTEHIIPTTAEIIPVLDMMKWNDIFCALVWTSVFAIKFAFLSFFHPLLLSMSRKTLVYYWFNIAFNVCCWAFLIVEPFITCTHFGLDAIKYCYQNFSHTTSVATNVIAGVLDIAGDVMIISIPIHILRQSLMKTTQKVGLAVFLCLSFVMIIVALVRMIGMLSHTSAHNHGTNPTWGTLFMTVEAGIAVMMSSLLVFRRFFLDRSQDDSGRSPWATITRACQYLLTRLKVSKTSAERESTECAEPRPRHISTMAMTKPSLKSLAMYLRGGSTKSGEVPRMDPETCSTTETDIEDVNYHNFVRERSE